MESWHNFFNFTNAIDVILLPKFKYLLTPTIPEIRSSHHAGCYLSIFNIPPIYHNKERSKGHYQLSENFSKSKTRICSNIGFHKKVYFTTFFSSIYFDLCHLQVYERGFFCVCKSCITKLRKKYASRKVIFMRDIDNLVEETVF